MDTRERLLVVVGVETTARVLPGGGSTPIATTVVEGAPRPVLAEATRGADLLVAGSHGRRRVFTALMGSISEYCIRNAACPVVVIPVRVRLPSEPRDAVARP